MDLRQVPVGTVNLSSNSSEGIFWAIVIISMALSLIYAAWLFPKENPGIFGWHVSAIMDLVGFWLLFLEVTTLVVGTKDVETMYWPIFSLATGAAVVYLGILVWLLHRNRSRRTDHVLRD